MAKPGELLVYEFFASQQQSASPGSLISELEIQDTIWQSITKPDGMRISDAVSMQLPDTGGGLKEFDADVQIVCFAKVEGVNFKERAAAVERVFDIQSMVVQMLINDQTLGGRFCDVLIKPIARGYDNLHGKPYATSLIPLTLNPSGY